MQVLDHVLANNYPRVGKRGWLEGMPLEPCPASEITFVVCEASEVGAGRTVEDRICPENQVPARSASPGSPRGL